MTSDKIVKKIPTGMKDSDFKNIVNDTVNTLSVDSSVGKISISKSSKLKNNKNDLIGPV